MMARAIDADDAILQIERREKYLIGDKCISVDAFKEFIKNRPTIDPVKHGNWIKKYGNWNSSECDKIGYKGYIPAKPSDYCPNCGARMDGE